MVNTRPGSTTAKVAARAGNEALQGGTRRWEKLARRGRKKRSRAEGTVRLAQAEQVAALLLEGGFDRVAQEGQHPGQLDLDAHGQVLYVHVAADRLARRQY